LSWRSYYWSGLAALFAWAAWQRFSLPLDPITDPDMWGYLSPALRKLIGAEFGHTEGRNFLYPGFVFLLLRAFGDFRAITVAQHILGLVAGVMLLLTWQRTRAFMPNPRVRRAAYDGLGLLAAGIFLLATEPMRFEKQLRPEAICAFLISLNLYFVVQFTARCFVEGRKNAVAGYGIAAVASSILLASVKPSFALVAIFALLPVVAFFFQRGRFRQKVALAAGALVSAALLLLPERSLSLNDEASQTFLPATLFVVHANLIRDQMAEDLAHKAAVPYPQEWLARIQAALDAEIAKSHAANPRHYPSLGFDPDYLMFNQDSIGAQLRREFENDVPGLCSFYRFCYARIWRQRPVRVLQKIAQQMEVFYTPVCPAYDRRRSWRLADEYGYSLMLLGLEPYRETLTAYPPAVDFMSRTESLSRNAPVVLQARSIQFLLLLLGGTYLPLLLVAVGLVGAVWWRGDRRQLRWCAVLILFGLFYNAISSLEVAIINSLEIRRYLTVQLFPVIFAQFLALWFLLEFFLERRATTKIPLQ
jgi:hypothetical protein